LLQLANSFINFVFTIPGMIFVDKFGRRPLLLYGAIAQSLFTIGFASTWGPVVWSYQAEIFPLRFRAKGVGISTMSNWAWNAVIAFAWPKIFAKVDHAPSAYRIFSAVCDLAAVWTYFAIPETKGKSLEEKEGRFSYT
ncbi:hypothetical protein DFJ73DRAFT_618551, partial [Zopfochytrium polystomum]